MLRMRNRQTQRAAEHVAGHVVDEARHADERQQQDVQDSIADVYLDQDDLHKSSSVDEAKLNERIITDKNARTLETPLFLTFTHDNGAKGYTYDANLSKVIFGMVGSLSNTSDSEVAKQMLDVYNFQIKLR